MKKRFLITLLTASLVLGSTDLPLSAVYANGGQGTITVNDTQSGATYSAYKIFDATVADMTTNNGAVSYLIPEGANYEADTAYQGLFNTVENGGRKYAVRKADATDEAIIAWAQGLNLTTAAVTVKEDGTNTTESLPVDYGYYLVKSDVNSGAVVMVTSASPNATINEKNAKPTWGEDGGKTTNAKTYSVGDTIEYTIDYKSATNFNGSKKVYQYVVKDTMPDANVVALNENSIVVMVGGQTLTQSDSGETGTYKLEKNGNSFTITIPWAASQAPKTNGDAEDFFYNGINNIKVTYTGVLKSGAAEGSAAANSNTVTINPNDETSDPGKEAKVYDGQITIKKVDAAAPNKTLAGAKFVLKKKDGKFLKFDNAADDWVEVDNQNEATVYTTNENGKVEISGLAAGDYQLIEIEAPQGYNLLKAPTDVTLAFDDNTADGDSLMATPTIENNTGAELPSTGGFGTTVFYTLGISLILGSAVVLVARRRLRD